MAIEASFELEGGGKELIEFIPEQDPVFNPIRDNANLNENITYDRTPDEEAEVLGLAEKTRWPVDVVRAGKKEAVQQSQKMDFQSINEQALLGFIGASSDNAALVRDDILALRDSMGYLERIQKGVSQAHWRGKANVELSDLYYNKYINESPVDEARIKTLEESIVAPVEQKDFIGKVGVAVGEQLPILGATIGAGAEAGAKGAIAGGGLALFGGPVAAVPGILLGAKAGFAVGAAQEVFYLEAGLAAKEYSDFVDENGQKLDPETVKYAAMTTGFLNAGLELTGMVSVLKTIPGVGKVISKSARELVKGALKKKIFRDALKRIGRSFGGAIGTETLTEMAQETIAIDVGEITKRLELPEAKEIEAAQKTRRILQAGEQAFLATFGIAGVGSTVSVTGAAIRKGVEIQKAKNVKERPEQFYNEQVGLTERLDETKTKTRSPVKTQELLENGGLIQDGLIDGAEAKEFYQIEDNAEIFAKLEITEQEVNEAAATGQSISIELAKIHSALSLEESRKFFQIVKETSDSLSFKDSKTINVSEELTRVNEAFETIEKEQTEFLKEKARVEAEIREVAGVRKLKQPETYARGLAEILGNFSQRMAIEGEQTPATTLKRIRTEVSNFKDIADAEAFIGTNDFQDAIPLGVTRIAPEGFIMKLFEGANHSTLLHETGHVFFNEVISIINMEKASEGLIKDFDVVKEWLQVDSEKGITVEQQDKFAEAFELYLREGKAPTKGLTPFFERFRKWLTTVYRKVKGSPIDVNLTDEVRGVFDRLISVENQTKQFVEENEFIVSDKTLDELELSEKERVDYRRRLAGASSTANKAIQRELAREHKRNIAVWREEAEIEVAGRRVNNLYADLTSLKRGFSLASSAQFLSAKELSLLDSKIPDVFNDEGMDPRLVTERFGYESVEKMFSDLLNEPSLSTEIERIRQEEQLRLKEAKERRKKGIEAIRNREREALEQAKTKDDKKKIRESAQEEISELRLISDNEQLKIKEESQIKQDEVRNNQVNSVRNFLSNPIVGFNQEELEFQFGKQTTVRLKAKNARLVGKDGQSVQSVALEYGYESMNEMVRDLESRSPRKIQIQEIVSRKEQEAYLNFTADDFFLNEKTKGLEKSLETLGKFIQRKAGVEIDTSAKDYKNEVNRKFATLPVNRATRTDRHLSAMRQALRNRDKAIKKGDFKEAVKFHEQARLNYEFARRSNKIRKDSQDLRKLVQKSGKSKGRIEFDYWKNIISLGNKFGLRKGKEPQNVKPFQNLLDAQASLLDSSVRFRPWIDEIAPQSFRELKVNQFEELKVLFEVLDYIGRKLILDETVLSDLKFAELKKQLVSMAETLKGRRNWDAQSRFGKLAEFGRSVFSDLNTLHSILINLDNFSEIGPKGIVGPWSQAVYDKLNKADSEYLRISDELSRRMKPALDQLNRSFRKYPKVISEITVPLPESLRIRRRGWRFETVVSIALNMGNRQNMEAVKEGYGLTEANLKDILSILSKEDWDAIQIIWDSIGAYREPLFDTKKRLDGFEPTIVEADEFVTPRGQTLKGGYYPLQRDLSLTPEKYNVNQNFRDTEKATVADGPTQERVYFGANPVKLNLSVLAQHSNFLALYLSHAEIIKDIGRIFSDSEVANVIVDKLGDETLRSIKDSLQNISKSKHEDLMAMDRFFEILRGLSTIYILGIKVIVAFKQFFSITNFIRQYGISPFFTGWSQAIKSALTGQFGKLKEEVYELSPFMKARGGNIDVSMHESIRKTILELPIPFAFGVKKSQVSEAMFILIRGMDFATTYPAWLGAFEKGKKEHNGDVNKAIAFADKAIRTTQPSFRPLDLSPIQASRKGMARAFTMFSTYTLLFGRLQRTQFKAWRQGRISSVNFFRGVMWESLIAPVSMNLFFAALRGEVPEPEDVIADIFVYNLMGIPLVKDFAVIISNLARGKWFGRDWDSPLFTPFELGAITADFIVRLIKDLDNDKRWKDAVLSMAELFSFAIGVPAPRVGRDVIKGMEQWERGEGTPFNILVPQKPSKK